MKTTIFRYAAFVCAVILCACSDDNERVTPDENLPVNYANIAGIWQLTTWNGEQMDDNRYLYMVITRKADEDTGRRALEIYQNIDSSKSSYRSSSYELEEDEDLGAIISGMYDHSAGFWNSSYRITDLTGESMMWTVKDDATDSSIYVRRDAIPEDILNGTRAL